MDLKGMLVTAIEAVPSGSISIPSWAEKLTVMGAMVLFAVALARGWLYTAGQVNRMEASWKEVSRHWEDTAKDRGDTIKELTAGFEPVVAGQEAILRAVQDRQEGRNPPPRGRAR